MKINNEKRKQIYDSYCKAETMLQNLRSIVQNEMDISDDVSADHFSKSQDLADMIMDLHDEINEEE